MAWLQRAFYRFGALNKLLGLCLNKSKPHEFVSDNSPLSLSVHFESVELPLNNLLVLIEIHEVVVEEMNTKTLHTCTSQSSSVFAIVFAFLVTCFYGVCLYTQVDVMV